MNAGRVQVSKHKLLGLNLSLNFYFLLSKTSRPFPGPI